MPGEMEGVAAPLARLAWGLAGLSLVVAIGVAVWIPPVPQWPEYHAFADRRAWLGIPNFADVVSNLLFSLVGLLGLARLRAGRHAAFLDGRERRAWWVFFFGLVLLGPASAGYHLAPDDHGLMLDRLAMSVVFMAWLAIHLGERIHPRLGWFALPVLLLLGVAAVLYWYAGARLGGGDLRAWAYVQFWPVLLLLILLWRAPARYSRGGDVLLVLLCHGLALGAESLDSAVLEWSGGMFSGHTLKHGLAALGAAWALRMLLKRCPRPAGG